MTQAFVRYTVETSRPGTAGYSPGDTSAVTRTTIEWRPGPDGLEDRLMMLEGLLAAEGFSFEPGTLSVDTLTRGRTAQEAR